jgi:quercetin dioxygenase-like cupin family protein
MIERLVATQTPEAALRRQGLRPEPWSASPGTAFSAHRHERTKHLYVVAGSVSFDGLQLHTGEGIRIPAGVEHSAIVGDDGVQCVEGFEAPAK